MQIQLKLVHVIEIMLTAKNHAIYSGTKEIQTQANRNKRIVVKNIQYLVYNGFKKKLIFQKEKII